MYLQVTYCYFIYDFEIWANINGVLLYTFSYDLLFIQQCAFCVSTVLM